MKFIVLGLELINDYSKVAGYKINTQKSLALAGEALTTGLPGKSPYFFFYTTLFSLYLTLFSE